MGPRAFAAIGFLLAAMLLATSAPALPVPNKIVIVIEENTDYGEMIGNPAAPYFNSLAAGGANFTNFFALTHPSQPNYLHLYSGANQGVLTNVVPAPGSPYTTPNLGAALLAIGKDFGIYSEDLPAVGSTVAISGAYARRHNPVVNWQVSTNPGPNQYGPQYNMPFSHFPTNFNDLPTVSFVIPNNDNNMHDGTIAEGDAWLQANIKPYADWATSNNSLLVVTWDEDSLTSVNRIPTILHGPMIKPGPQSATWTLHNLLRTVEEMHGTTHSGSARLVPRIVGPFVGDPEMITATLRHGTAGYSSTSDTHVESTAAGTVRGADTSVAVTSSTSQGLIRFDGIFGNGVGQAPLGAKILSAKLSLITTQAEFSNENIALHRMLVGWGESSTWNTLEGGVSMDDVEAQSTPEFRVIPNVALAPAIFDVTRSIALWALDPALNHGWLLRGTTPADLWRWRSSEHATLADRPALEITYERPHWGIDASGLWSSSASWISGIPSGPGAKANFLRGISAPRTVSINSPVTVGSLTFDSNVPYTLAGAPLTVAALSGVPSAIDVLSGRHTIVADVELQEDTPININDAARLDISGGLRLASGKVITKIGNGVLNTGGGISSSDGELVIEVGVVETKFFHGIAARISAGGRAAVTPDGSSAATSRLLSLDIEGAPDDWQGQLDLSNNAMVIQADAATRLEVLERVANQIATGRNSGASLWLGQGITSSSAAASGGVMGLAVLLNGDGGAPLYTDFRGQAADANSILVRYTLVGDMDLDGDIDADDYSRIDAGYAAGLAGYWNGDLDYNGRTDADDYFLIDRAFSSNQNPMAAALLARAAVPEPSALGLGAVVASALCLRLRRLTK